MLPFGSRELDGTTLMCLVACSSGTRSSPDSVSEVESKREEGRG